MSSSLYGAAFYQFSYTAADVTQIRVLNIFLMSVLVCLPLCSSPRTLHTTAELLLERERGLARSFNPSRLCKLPCLENMVCCLCLFSVGMKDCWDNIFSLWYTDSLSLQCPVLCPDLSFLVPCFWETSVSFSLCSLPCGFTWSQIFVERDSLFPPTFIWTLFMQCNPECLAAQPDKFSSTNKRQVPSFYIWTNLCGKEKKKKNKLLQSMK